MGHVSRLRRISAAALAVVVTYLVGIWGFAQADGGPASGSRAPRDAQRVPLLKDIYAQNFFIGTALDFRRPDEFSDRELEIITSQFNIITPENSMKPAMVHPEEDRWEWTVPDRLVEFCQKNRISIIGHTLLWHAQTNNWFFQNADGSPAPKELVLSRLRNHIQTLVRHYQGKIKGWDVVNEAIDDSPHGDTENLRRSQWLRSLGPDFPLYAFKFAREADPNVELYYNDYNIERGDKHKSSVLLLKRLLSQGAPITAVGIQGHWSLTYLPYEEIDQAIADYKALGLKVNITELDITIQGTGGGQLTAAAAPAAAPSTLPATTRGRGRGPFARGPVLPPSPEQLKAQAEAYAKLFAIFLKHDDAIERVTFWGINDRRTWRFGQSPLLFDNDNKPKIALQAIADAKREFMEHARQTLPGEKH